MDNLTFYYFSGTGNSKHVCDWFSDEAENSGIKVEKINLSVDRQSPEVKAGNSIGIISPTHGFNYPPLVLHFILRFPRTKNKTKVFLMNTRAGMKLSKLFLPGGSGIALWLSAIILLFKGYKIISLRSIDLPSNWISLHPGLRQKVITSMFTKYEKDTREYARKIVSGKNVFRKSLWLFMPVDLALAPLAFGYYIIGRFVLAKTFMASYLCDNCNLCIKQCPIKAISLVDNRPYWSFRCESCMHCMNICPRRAIESTHGYLALVVILLYSLILTGLYSIYPPNEWPLLKTGFPGSGFIRFTFESALILLLLLITYRLVHFLKRYRWFDNLITYTSLTKFTFWRRYKAPH
jgi:ferredoxin